jgi:hypothetical protein
MAKKTIYLVSDTSHSEGIYNNVHAFSTKQEAIESANAYIEEANENVSEEFKCNKNFNDYKVGYKEIEINDYHTGYVFLISITEQNISV